jgi:hypothetical protein
MEPERDRDRDHDDGGDGEHHDVTQDRAQQQGEPAGGRDAEPLDHAGVHFPDDDPPGAHARAEGLGARMSGCCRRCQGLR